jgi:putative SOS response-associated peptidase YedK
LNARYLLKDTPYEVSEHYGITPWDNAPPRYNIAPSQPVPIIVQNGETHAYELVRWGFVPSWDREGRWLKKPMINVRSETAHEKPMFQAAFRRRHCLFPMNGFYEWREEGGVKQPYVIGLGPDLPLFSLAGIYEDWLGADGSELRTAAFLTRASEGEVSAIHSRTPVVVRAEDYARWLHADETDLAPAFEIIARPQADYVYWPVDRAVGSWKAEGEQLAAPIEGGELRHERAPPAPRTRLL